MVIVSIPYYEYFHTLAYSDKTWGVMRRKTFLDSLRLYGCHKRRSGVAARQGMNTSSPCIPRKKHLT